MKNTKKIIFFKKRHSNRKKNMRSCVDKEKAGKLSMYEALRACFQERAFCVCFMQKDSDMISGLLKMPKTKTLWSIWNRRWIYF